MNNVHSSFSNSVHFIYILSSSALIVITTTCCIITGLFISLKKHCETVSEKEPILADEDATVRALLKNKNAEKYV
jgi:hypothetical protein